MTNSASLHSMILFATAAVLLVAAAHDVAVRTVPNYVSAIVAASGLVLNALDGQLLPALFGGGLVFAAAWYFWRRGWLGGGDVKLLTACVLLVPPTSVPELILSTAIAGGVLALTYVTLARLLPGGAITQSAGLVRPAGLPASLLRPGSLPGSASLGRANLLRRIWRAERRRIRRGLSLPYSCAITVGALLTLYLPFG